MTYLSLCTRTILFALAIFCSVTCNQSHADEKLKALIIDGQNNHGMWPKTTAMMKAYLEETGKFEVDIARTKFTWNGDDLLEEYSLPGMRTISLKQPQTDPDFKPDFSKYDVVISNFGYNAAPWPKETQDKFVAYMLGGGGLVVVHAADNSFGDWPEYNLMIGLGGWGGRTQKSGPYVYIGDDGNVVRDDSEGHAGSHGPQQEYPVEIRKPDHPIMKNMPNGWMHTQDEIYDSLRGPAENMTILASTFSKATGRHEPVMMTIKYGRGRVFHTTMGHADYSFACVGMMASLQRGAEWVATGEVTQELPKDFPTTEATSSREFGKE